MTKPSFSVDLASFRSIVPTSQPWEAYVQGREAIHAEYGNLSSTEPKLKLAAVNRCGARMTAPTRRERLFINGCFEPKEKVIRAKVVATTLSGDFPPPEAARTLRESIEPKLDPGSMSAEALWKEILTNLKWIIERLGDERFQLKVWSGWEFRGYYNSLGSEMTSCFPISKLKIGVLASGNSLIKRTGAREGVEFFTGLAPGCLEGFFEDIECAKTAPNEESVPKALIFDPEAAAMFLHEAVGHAAEGDNVLAGNSYLSALSGRRIAPPNVTIVDSPRDYPGLGSYPFDDEGVLAQTTPLLENGMVQRCLTDRALGVALETESTGNCRSFWYDATPKVRMSNMVMLPGEGSSEAILRETKDGLLVKGMREGGCDEKTGDFHFKPNITYRVTDGELKGPVIVPEVAGNARKYLKSISNVSREWSLSVAGCGKPTPQSDYAWVGYGAPFMKFQFD